MMSAEPGRLLLVEDDRELGPLIVELLEGDFVTTLARDGQQGLHQALTNNWDAMVIDRGLPVMDGVALIQAIRAKGVTTPVLILTARGSVQDKVEGLDAGANDYLVKPFDAAELAARLRALTRTFARPALLLPIGAWDFDPRSRTVTSIHGERVRLAPREAELLAVLAAEPDKVFSRADLLAAAFDPADQPGVVDTYVHYLRRKIDKRIIETVHGAGYQLGDPA